jgi:hypothetical protein
MKSRGLRSGDHSGQVCGSHGQFNHLETAASDAAPREIEGGTFSTFVAAVKVQGMLNHVQLLSDI